MRKKLLALLLAVCMAVGMLPTVAVGAESWLWPVNGVYAMSRGYFSGHYGIDIAASLGTTVRATKSGTVIESSNSCSHTNYGTGCSCNGGCGNYVKIKHNDGTYSRYLHLTQGTAIAVNTKVSQGDTIGKSGSSGDSTGPHLHFECYNTSNSRINNNPTDSRHSYSGNHDSGAISYIYNIVSPNNMPIGYLDSVTGGQGTVTVRGWAYDPDSTSSSVSIHVYVGGSAGTSGAYGIPITANKKRTDVNKVYSCGDYHGFEETIVVPKTGSQEVWVYAIDTANGGNTVLGHKTVTISKDSTKPTISNVKVSDISSTGYTVSCTVTDNVGVSRVQFPTWTVYGDQDDIQSDWGTSSAAAGTQSGNTWTYRVKISDHNYEVGRYATHIYAYDAAGNYSSVIAGTNGEVQVPAAAVLSYNGHKYQYISGLTTWADAKTYCEQQGGHLATITSAGEQTALYNYMQEYASGSAWIGYQDADEEGTWKWITGETSSYTNWGSGEPNNYKGDQDYGNIYMNGSWDDASGTVKKGLLCEWDCLNGHTWNSGEVTAQPTTTSEGVRTYTCTMCGETKTEAIAKLPADTTDTATPTEVTNPFVDVTSGDWFFDPVLWAVDNGITLGTSDTTFSPNDSCTRAQIVTFLWRNAGSPTPTSSYNPFTDVQSGDWYESAVLWAVEQGITVGTSATTFSPNDTCIRSQAMTFLWRVKNTPGSDGNNPFTDVAPGEWYTDAVLWAVENGITVGTSATTFSPNETCTRGQIVTFLCRAA